MSSYRNVIMQGDALATLRGLDDGCVQMVCSSPPYYRLRNYGSPEQIGLEDTPDEYVKRLVEVFREVRRVLRSDGVAFINLGDSYANDDKWGGSTGGKHVIPLHGNNAMRERRRTGLAPKNLIGIPWRVAFGLQDDGWILRSDIIWSKGNPMPSSVKDRVTSSHEYVFMLAKSERYFYDADAIAEPSVSGHPSGNGFKRDARLSYLNTDGSSRGNDQQWHVQPTRNRRSVWQVNTQPYPGSHFAVMPQKLAEICILAGSSPQACEICGAPWQRRKLEELIPNPGGGQKRASTMVPGNSPVGTTSVFRTGMSKISHTTGWEPTCSCDNTGSGRCIVLDHFAGAGTSCYVASRFGRDYLGIELNPEYVALAEKRVAELTPGLWGFSERAAQGK